LGNNSSSTTSLWVDNLVKGFLILILAARAGEGECNFLPPLAVVFVDEGTSSNSSAGGGEKYLFGE
jgi:hypothetical protein